MIDEPVPTMPDGAGDEPDDEDEEEIQSRFSANRRDVSSSLRARRSNPDSDQVKGLDFLAALFLAMAASEETRRRVVSAASFADPRTSNGLLVNRQSLLNRKRQRSRGRVLKI